jgi:hypothetical protein
VHGTPRRRHRQDVSSCLAQSPVELLQDGRLPRAGGTAQTDRPVARGDTWCTACCCSGRNRSDARKA